MRYDPNQLIKDTFIHINASFTRLITSVNKKVSSLNPD